MTNAAMGDGRRVEDLSQTRRAGGEQESIAEGGEFVFQFLVDGRTIRKMVILLKDYSSLPLTLSQTCRGWCFPPVL